jgi:putative protease
MRHAVSPLKPGDGVVFDAADWRSPGEPEEGGRVYEVTSRGGNLEVDVCQWRHSLRSHPAGDILWRTDDPALHSQAKPFTEAPVPCGSSP